MLEIGVAFLGEPRRPGADQSQACQAKGQLMLACNIIYLVLLLNSMSDVSTLPSGEVPFGLWLSCLSSGCHLQSAGPVLNSLLNDSLMRHLQSC